VTPDEFTLEFAIKFTAEGNALVAKASAEANLKITMKYVHVKQNLNDHPALHRRIKWQGRIIGNGFVVHASGLVATAYHVLRDAVQPFEGQTFTFELLADPKLGTADVNAIPLEATALHSATNDVALLQMRAPVPDNLAVAPLIHSDESQARHALPSPGLWRAPQSTRRARVLVCERRIVVPRANAGCGCCSSTASRCSKA
jgi:hypothetical protein